MRYSKIDDLDGRAYVCIKRGGLVDEGCFSLTRVVI